MATMTFNGGNSRVYSMWNFTCYSYTSSGTLYYKSQCSSPSTGQGDNITFNTSAIPAGAIVTSAIVSYNSWTDKQGSYNSTMPLNYSNSTIRFNGNRIYGGGSQDITSLLTPYNGGTFQNISIAGTYASAYVRDYVNTEGFVYNFGTANGQRNGICAAVDNITLTVEYTIPEVGDKVYYGVNGTWQKCEVYLGTNGTWQKVYPYFGTGGGWN